MLKKEKSQNQCHTHCGIPILLPRTVPTSLSRTLLLLAMFIIGCTTDSIQSQPVHAQLVPGDELPSFQDDLQLEGLALAVRRQLAILHKTGNQEALRIGKVSYSSRQLLASLERFNQLIGEAEACKKKSESPTHCMARFGQQIREQFQVYRLEPSLLTAYYTPTIEVSKQRTDQFRYPIYRTPDTTWERHLSRDEIDFEGKLEGKGYELYYAADRFDVYIIHVEGGARIIVNDDGQRYIKYLHYHTDNGQEFSHLYDYMLNHDLLESNNWSRWDQRAALKAHPEVVRKVYASCPGYVFFKVSDKPSITHTGIVLTANRSSATDPAYYPVKGIITYVVSPIPMPPAEGTPSESNPETLHYQTMKRFFIDQDIGNNVTGAARADLFFGEGPYAEFLSNNFMTKGIIYLLFLK